MRCKYDHRSGDFPALTWANSVRDSRGKDCSVICTSGAMSLMMLLCFRVVRYAWTACVCIVFMLTAVSSGVISGSVSMYAVNPWLWNIVCFLCRGGFVCNVSG